MKVSDLFRSNYLNASDVADGPLNLTVISFGMQDVAGNGNPKDFECVIHFKEIEKGLILKPTNGNLIALIHGDDMDGWIGKVITFRTEMVPFKGDIVPGIRAVPVSNKPAEVKA